MLKTYSLKSTIRAGAAAVGLLALPGALFAGTAAKETKIIEAPKATSAISGDAGFNFVSAYFSRGILQENQGAIFEPYADLFIALYEGDGIVNKLTANFSVWSSIQAHHPGVVSTTGSWYEFDWMPGVSLTLAKNFTLTVSYYQFDSPNDSFRTSGNLNVNLAYNDADLLGKFALHPHVTYLRELTGKAGLGTEQGNYYEVGIAPALPAMGPLTVSFPLTAGFGNAGFYEVHTSPVTTSETNFGYLSVGPSIAVALPLPSRYGAWTFNASAIYYHLNGTVAAADVNRHNDWVFSGGLGVAF